MVAEGKKVLKHSPKPIYVIFGSDPFLRAEQLADLLQQLLGPQSDATNLSEYQGESAELADVLDACRTPSLFSTLRVVCMRNADTFVSTYRAQLERYLHGLVESRRKAAEEKQSPPELSGVLVLDCRTWQKTTRLYKLVAEIGLNMACVPPKTPDQFAVWSVRRAKSVFNCSMLREVAERLVDLVGDDLGRLSMELAKLSTYISPRSDIRLEDIEELVGASRSEIVFKITDAIAQHDAQTAVSLWQRVLATDRAAPFRSVGGLAFGFRRLAEAKRLVNRGMAAGEVKGMLRIWGGDAISLDKQLRRFSLAQWRDHLVKLLRIDLGAKTGLGTVESSVEKMIVELCS